MLEVLYLEAAGGWTPQWQEELESTAASEIEAAIGEAEALDPLGPADVFSAMFAQPQPHLEHQLGMLEDGLDG